MKTPEEQHQTERELVHARQLSNTLRAELEKARAQRDRYQQTANEANAQLDGLRALVSVLKGDIKENRKRLEREQREHNQTRADLAELEGIREEGETYDPPMEAVFSAMQGGSDGG